MALHIPTNLPSGTTDLVHRLPASSLALLARLERLAHTGLSRVRADTRLRRGRSFARFAVATAALEVRHHLPGNLASSTRDPARDLLPEHLPAAANELSRRLGRSPRPSELATLLGVDVDSVVEVVADDRSARLDRSEDDPGGAAHRVGVW
jgi:RNA polymerase sigma-B factor